MGGRRPSYGQETGLIADSIFGEQTVEVDHARAPQDRSHRLSVADPAIYRSVRGVSLRSFESGARCRAARQAIPYDVPDVQFSHRGELCSFDAFIAEFGLDDPALADLAQIVRGADTGNPGLTPQSAGLLAVSLGLSVNYPDDHAMLEQGMVIYDALYAWLRSARAEIHNADLFRKKA
jgi:hypothetical protein